MMGRHLPRKSREPRNAEALSKGAKVLTGGRRPEAMKKGFFYEPTVLSGVDHSMLIMREETFGPAIPLNGIQNI
jgi:succinate-semialdehyde dehydrogenase/glutarate-semialdehyde dehydrogenase